MPSKQAGLQRAASPLSGLGVSPKNLFFFFFPSPLQGGEKQLGAPQAPAGRTLHPLDSKKLRFAERAKRGKHLFFLHRETVKRAHHILYRNLLDAFKFLVYADQARSEEHT